MVIQADCMKWLAGQPNGAFGSVITDPPEDFTSEQLRMLLRVSRGPVVIMAPCIWIGESFPRSTAVRGQDAVDVWLCNSGPQRGWAPILLYRCKPNGCLGEHETKATIEKPLALMQGIVGAWGALTVLDPFCGTGTTGIACRDLGFDFIGIEQSHELCEVARRRICEETVDVVS